MPKNMRIRVDQGELMPVRPDVVNRDDVGPGGTLGLWDGFGKLVIEVSGRRVMILQVREDSAGETVLRALADPDMPAVSFDGIDGCYTDVNLERARLIDGSTTSKDRGWIADEERR